ncbi:MAG: AI-2E family transporter [Gaiellaceae bacterium]
MRETARRAFIGTVVAGGVVVLALALWKIRILLAILFLAFIIAAAMRPTVDALQRRRIPRGVSVLLHYFGILGAIGVFIWLVVPKAINQVQDAIDNLPEATEGSKGIKHEILEGIQDRLDHLPSGDELLDPALEITTTAFEVVIGIFFTLATAAYWIFERQRAQRLVLSLVPRPKRRVVRDTWDLIDLKLGAFVRGQIVLIVLVGTVLSICFAIAGLPYWILVGAFGGVVEIVPVIGPLAAGALAVGVGLTESWQLGLAAGLIVLIVRLLEDYLVIPKVLGDAVGLSPLVVLVSVTAVGLLFGGFAVLLAVPLAAVLATLVDVIVLDKNPADGDVPAVLFPAQDSE